MKASASAVEHTLEAGLQRPDDRHPMVSVVDELVTHTAPPRFDMDSVAKITRPCKPGATQYHVKFTGR